MSSSVPVGTTKLIRIRDLSDTGVPVGTTGLIQIQNLSDTGAPVGTIGLIQIRDLSDAGVPVGTTEHIRSGLVRYRSTRRYYRTDQIRTCQIQEYP